MISFLIPTLPKNKDFLTLCVNSIIENTINDLEFEILIGENGEGTPYPQGQCKAVNRIARQAKGEWLFVCFQGNTLIETLHGAKQIKNIKIGELVKTHRNRYRKVVKIYQNELKRKSPILWIQTDNSTTKCTPNHPFMVLRNNKVKWVKAHKLSKNDNLLYPSTNKKDTLKFNCWGNNIKNNNFGSYNVDKDLARFLGLYLAEGCKGTRGITFSFNKNETLLHNFIKKVSNEKFGRKVTKEIRRNGNVTLIKLNINSFIKLFENWFGKYATQKRVPSFVFNWKLENKLSFIKGYLEGDGNIKNKNYNGAIATSSNKKLIKDLKKLCCLSGLETGKILNFPPSKAVYNGRIIQNTGFYRIKIKTHSWSKLLDILKGKRKRNYVIIKIKNILNKKLDNSKKIYQTVYNLAVDKDNSYIANSAIVHNCNDDMYFPKGWNKFLTFPSACLSTNVNWCSAPVEGLSFVDLNAGTELDFDKKKVDDFMKNHNDKSVVNGFNFPLIIKKDLWDFIEGYDENYDPWGSNSDSDLEYKVKLVGVQPKKLNGVFVYHFCSKSDMYSHQDFMQKNYDYFENKWGFQRVDTPYIQRAEFEIPMDKLKYKPNFKK